MKTTLSSVPPDTTTQTILYCNTCGIKLSTRNKLFKHISDTGHALKVDNNERTVSAKSSKKMKRKK